MSEAMNPWYDYVGTLVMVQLRAQPYIGVTQEEMTPVMANSEFVSTPVIRGFVSGILEADGDTYLQIQTTDPDPDLSQNVVEITLSVKQAVGYITRISAKKVQLA